VIPIRGITPAAEPAVVQRALLRAFGAAQECPVEARPWRILFVPPTPGAQTRALHLEALAAAHFDWRTHSLVVGRGNRGDDDRRQHEQRRLFLPKCRPGSDSQPLSVVEDSLMQARAALATAEDLVNGPRSIRALESGDATSPALVGRTIHGRAER
jgi:hypothetical protein